MTSLTADDLISALREPFAVVFLDGRNEHGAHVAPSFPTNLPLEWEDTEPYAEQIMVAAEALGFKPGEDHVWTVWRWNAPQYGDYGREELPGYWEFVEIKAALSRAIGTTP